jgi:Zn-dependent protease with chaperone function
MTTCIGLTVLAVMTFGPAGVWLERAAWPRKAPRAAIALWQAIGVTGALAAVGAGLALAVEPLHVGLIPGVGDLLHGSSPGHPLPIKGLYEAFGLTLSANVVAVLVAGVAITATRTVASRRRHRILLDLVSLRSDQAPGAVLLSDSRATAYCLPGRRSRIVVSAGALDLLDSRELAAVVDHERGHVQERHHLILLPFASMIEMLNWMPYVSRAPRAVRALLEMAADDYATRFHPPRVLASALIQMVHPSAVPTCAFGAASGSITVRVSRLLDQGRKSRAVAVAASVAAGLLVLVPLLVMGLD